MVAENGCHCKAKQKTCVGFGQAVCLFHAPISIVGCVQTDQNRFLQSAQATPCLQQSFTGPPAVLAVRHDFVLLVRLDAQHIVTCCSLADATLGFRKGHVSKFD